MSECELKKVSINKFGLRLIAYELKGPVAIYLQKRFLWRQLPLLDVTKIFLVCCMQNFLNLKRKAGTRNHDLKSCFSVALYLQTTSGLNTLEGFAFA